MPSLVEQLDAQLEHILKGWSTSTSIIAVLLVLFLIYPLFTSDEADTHPLLLTRQATIAPIRKEGESAAYRSLETPFGYPLKSGLGVKEEGASRWAPGRDGDMRDIWRQVVSPLSEDGQRKQTQSKILTIYGKEEVEQHSIQQLTKEINIIGKYVKQKGGSTVAISLPNSVEGLVTVFAAAFYGFTPVLLPPAQSENVALALVSMSQADFVITQAGSIPIDALKQQCPNVKEIIFVVEKTSRHMDWKSGNNTSAWHEIVEDAASSASSEPLPDASATSQAPNVVTIWQNEKATSGEIVSFTQSNIVSAVAAQISALPMKQRINDSDLFLPADALSNPSVFVQTLAALHSTASVAFNSVAGEEVDLQVAASSISPTIIACSAHSALKLHSAMSQKVQASSAKKFALSSQTASLRAGIMPVSTFGSSLNPPAKATIGKVAGKLRLLYVFERANAGSPPLSPKELSDLRAFTGARVIYALTAAKVAGTVTQTSFYDYRIDDKIGKGKHAHFGVPVSAVEVKVLDTQTHKTTQEGNPTGTLLVLGPAVQNGKAELNVLGTFRQDGTLAYAS